MTVKDRFMKHVTITAFCWLWQGKIGNRGYGVFSWHGKRVSAHRASWMLAHGREPATGMFICHHCDVPSCVNPMHLFEGTHQDNIDDMVRKGRSGRRGEGCHSPTSRRRKRPTSRPKTFSAQRKRPSAWLSLEQVDLICQLAKSRSQSDIARQFGVHQTTVHYILKKRKAESV